MPPHQFSQRTLQYYSDMSAIDGDVRADLKWTADVLRTRHCLCDEDTGDCPKFSGPVAPQ